MNNNKVIAYMINEAAFTPKAEDVSVVDEKNNRVTIQTILQDCNVRNRNGRFYSDKEMASELKSERTKELLRTENFFGEAGHPLSKDISRQQVIDPRNISHKILKLWMDGNDIKAHVRGSASAVGKEFNDHILDGTIPSFSLRALGSIQRTNNGAEVKNVKIVTWDWVIFPSHKRAYMENIVTESAGFKEENGILVPDHKGQIEPIVTKQVIDYITKESANISSVLESFDKIFTSTEIIANGTKVRLMNEAGEMCIVNLENHIQDKIMDYCYRY